MRFHGLNRFGDHLKSWHSNMPRHFIIKPTLANIIVLNESTGKSDGKVIAPDVVENPLASRTKTNEVKVDIPMTLKQSMGLRPLGWKSSGQLSVVTSNAAELST